MFYRWSCRAWNSGRPPLAAARGFSGNPRGARRRKRRIYVLISMPSCVYVGLAILSYFIGFRASGGGQSHYMRKVWALWGPPKLRKSLCTKRLGPLRGVRSAGITIYEAFGTLSGSRNHQNHSIRNVWARMAPQKAPGRSPPQNTPKIWYPKIVFFKSQLFMKIITVRLWAPRGPFGGSSGDPPELPEYPKSLYM